MLGTKGPGRCRLNGSCETTHLSGVPHISAQLDLDDVFRVGCCSKWGKRVVELAESHFLDYHRDYWDLYAKTTYHSCEMGGSSNVVNHDFILLAQNQAVSEEFKAAHKGSEWEYLGLCQASIMRMDLEFYLHSRLLSRLQDPKRQHHFHFSIFMDSFTDRDQHTGKGHRAGKRGVLSDRSTNQHM